MTGDNITRFPTSHAERRKNSLGPFVVECIVSNRFFAFSKTAEAISAGSAIWIDVMTSSDDEHKTRKICSLAVTKEDLQRALDHIKLKEDSEN